MRMKIKIPEEIELAFQNAKSPEEHEIHALIADWNASEATKFEQELFKQTKRVKGLAQPSSQADEFSLQRLLRLHQIKFQPAIRACASSHI